jgi:SAM-dependent methyltransferase
MTEPAFDAEGIFDEDYLYFYAGPLDARADAEAGLIWSLLEVEPGMEVLDLACGHGRIANALAARGARVTGLDAAPLFLDRARQDAAARRVAVTYVDGDMRDLPWTSRFALETNHRDWVLRHFQPEGVDERDGNLVIDRRHFEPLTGRIVAERMVVRDGRVRRFPYFARH